jgi:hypothetical protein
MVKYLAVSCEISRWLRLLFIPDDGCSESSISPTSSHLGGFASQSPKLEDFYRLTHPNLRQEHTAWKEAHNRMVSRSVSASFLHTAPLVGIGGKCPQQTVFSLA